MRIVVALAALVFAVAPAFADEPLAPTNASDETDDTPGTPGENAPAPEPVPLPIAPKARMTNPTPHVRAPARSKDDGESRLEKK